VCPKWERARRESAASIRGDEVGEWRLASVFGHHSVRVWVLLYIACSLGYFIFGHTFRAPGGGEKDFRAHQVQSSFVVVSFRTSVIFIFGHHMAVHS